MSVGPVKRHDAVRRAQNIAKPRNWAAAMMKKLVFDSDNIKLVLCGHSGAPSKMSADILYENSKGRKIPVVMFNPQAVGGWNGNGGDGWLRILEFIHEIPKGFV